MLEVLARARVKRGGDTGPRQNVEILTRPSLPSRPLQETEQSANLRITANIPSVTMRLLGHQKASSRQLLTYRHDSSAMRIIFRERLSGIG